MTQNTRRGLVHVWPVTTRDRGRAWQVQLWGTYDDGSSRPLPVWAWRTTRVGAWFAGWRLAQARRRRRRSEAR